MEYPEPSHFASKSVKWYNFGKTIQQFPKILNIQYLMTQQFHFQYFPQEKSKYLSTKSFLHKCLQQLYLQQPKYGHKPDVYHQDIGYINCGIIIQSNTSKQYKGVIYRPMKQHGSISKNILSEINQPTNKRTF